MSFAEASAVRLESDEGDVSVWSAEVEPGWDVGGNTNGGYLMSTVGRAIAGATARPDPVTITGHYLTPVGAGPATIEVRVLRRGRRFSTASASLTFDGRIALAVLATFGDLADSDPNAPELLLAEPPDLPAPESLTRVPAGDPLPPAIMGKVELLPHPDDNGFLAGRPSGTPRIRGWFGLLGGESVDTIALPLAVDVWPPTIFNANLPIAWTPTVELTVHVRARPAPGRLACEFRTGVVSAGFLESDGLIWDAAGRVVAQSRQLALVPRAQ
jgi:hypothetical protein